MESQIPISNPIPPNPASSAGRRHVPMWIALGIIILGTGAVSVWALNYAKQTDYTPEVPKTDEFADWKTYQNEEYGFSFKYPETWEIPTVSADARWIILGCPKIKFGGDFSCPLMANVYVRMASDSSLWEYLTTNEAKMDKSMGLEIASFTTKGEMLEDSAHQVVISDRLFVDFSDYLQNYEQNGILESIISTFQFSESRTQEIVLKVGEQKGIAGKILTLKLVSVNDSRCPAEPDVQCVWAGTVTARVELSQNSVSLGEVEVKIDKQIEIGGRTIKFTAIEPQEKRLTTRESDYILTFMVYN